MKWHKFSFQDVYKTFSTQVDERQAKLMAKGLPKKQPLPEVTDIVVIASGKGGVGKSTTSGKKIVIIEYFIESLLF